LEGFQVSPKVRSFPWLCWEACDGDSLLALDLALRHLLLRELLGGRLRLLDDRYVISA